MQNVNKYMNPLVERYGSKEMLYVFSPKMKFSTWRELWLALAEIQKDLGLGIDQEQIDQIKENLHSIDFEKAAEYEKKFRHDVMAHVHALGDAAPKAKAIIHLGATSAFVGDNTDLIQMKKGMELLKIKLINLINGLASFANQYKDLPTLGFTHYQPAQLTTVGKRATLWIQSVLLDLEELEFRLNNFRFRGVKGTTGTAESFKQLFDGDYQKVKTLDRRLSHRFGFKESFSVTGQTYDRKVDAQILNLLSNIAQSAHKFSNDIRLLQNLKEIEEPFEKNQIGSSAMAYKRNPMCAERISSLAKFVISLANSSAQVAANQWLERTLDDSANKRLSIPQAFLATDALVLIWINVINGLVVYKNRIRKRIMEELPFMATESIIMEEVKKGGNRQEIHEIIRLHAMEAAKRVKQKGLENDLIKRLAEDKRLSVNKDQLNKTLDPNNFVGFAEKQTEDFLNEQVSPILNNYKNLIGIQVSLIV